MIQSGCSSHGPFEFVAGIRHLESHVSVPAFPQVTDGYPPVGLHRVDAGAGSPRTLPIGRDADGTFRYADPGGRVAPRARIRSQGSRETGLFADCSLFRLTWIIYGYIIRVMKGSAGRNREACSMARGIPGLTIAVSVVAVELVPDGIRHHAQRGDIGLRGAASRARRKGGPWPSASPLGSMADVVGSPRGDAGQRLRRLEDELRTVGTRDHELARRLRRQEEEEE